MKLLFTSDWQITWSNIDKCEVVLNDLLSISQSESVSAIVHCGDVKHQINPVDVRVINFGVKFVKRIKQAGLDIYIDEGNHDKLGMHDTSDNWFPALKESGAVIINKPKVLNLADGYKLHVVPFYRDLHVSKTALETVSQSAHPTKSVLVFHNEIYGCKYNASTVSKSEQALQTGDLHWKKYMFCVGGHIHLPQFLTRNTRYVGSPFAHDWGEANQKKGYVLVDLENGTWRFIKSSLPRLYDSDRPGYIAPKSWESHSLRLHIRVPDGVPNVGSYLQTERDKAKSNYPGANIVTVPEFGHSDKEVLNIKTSNSDIDNITAYVEQTRSAGVGDNHEQLCSLLQYYLSKTQMLSSNAQKIKLLWAEGRNFLCFKKVKIKFNVPGITVVTGVNKDRPGHSNGSGKTSFFQLPLVAFFGKTLKGQTGDKWARRYSKKTAYDKLVFKLPDGRKCSILQQRRPVKLQLLVDGKDLSTGIGVKGTQKAIEQLTGLTWETIVNAMYIDQVEVTSLLSGKDSIRKTLFSKFLNLDRFTKAQSFVKERATLCRSTRETNEMLLANLEEQKKMIENFLKSLPEKQKVKQVVKQQKSLQHLKDNITRKIDLIEQKSTELDTKNLETIIDGTRRAIAKFNSRAEVIDESLQAIGDITTPKCPTCFQTVNKGLLQQQIRILKSRQLTWHALAKKQKAALKSCEESLHQTTSNHLAQQNRYESLFADKREVNYKLERIETELVSLQKSLENAKTWRAELRAASKSLKSVKQYLTMIESELALLKYASNAFSASGLPMYIAGNIIPQLNAAVEKYSEKFSDNEISVKFSMTEDAIEPVIENIHGGEFVSDQSKGELRIASLIVVFALQEVLNPTNVMMIDEPGEGLDEQAAKKFSKGLKEIAQELGPVFVTTHNPNVLAELAGERILEIVKENRVSTVKEIM